MKILLVILIFVGQTHLFANGRVALCVGQMPSAASFTFEIEIPTLNTP